MQIAHAGGAVLVRHDHFADDAVGEDGDLAGSSRPARCGRRRSCTSRRRRSRPCSCRRSGTPAGCLVGDGQRRLADVDQRRAERRRGALQDLVAALHRHRRQELAVRQILEAVAVAADADFALDRVVVGRQVLVVDRPVLAGAFERAPLEVALAEPQRHGIPQHRLAADAAAALRVEPFLARPHRRDLRLGKSNGIAWVLKSVRVFDARAALDDGDADAAAREVRGQRAAGGAGADDDDVEDSLCMRRAIVRPTSGRGQPGGTVSLCPLIAARGLAMLLSVTDMSR